MTYARPMQYLVLVLQGTKGKCAHVEIVAHTVQGAKQQNSMAGLLCHEPDNHHRIQRAHTLCHATHA